MDDKALVEATLHGELAAFGTLVQRYQRQIITSARHLTRSHEDAEDLAQETLVEAYRHLHTLQDHAKFRAWLFSILRHKCLNYLQRRDPEALALEMVEDTLAAPPPAGNGLLCDLLDSLPLPDREVLTARYLQELEYDDIAAMLGVTPQVVRMRCSRAKARARLLVLQQGGKAVDPQAAMRQVATALLPVPILDTFTDRVLMEVNTMATTSSASALAASSPLVPAAAVTAITGWKIAAIVGVALALAGASVPVVRHLQQRATPPTPAQQVAPAGITADDATPVADKPIAQMTEDEKLERCKANMQAIAKAIVAWAEAHDGNFPYKSDWAAQVGIDAKLLVCPGRPDQQVGYTPVYTLSPEPENLYKMLQQVGGDKSKVMILTDGMAEGSKKPSVFPHDNKFLVVFADGHAEEYGEEVVKDAERRAKESALRGNLHIIRTAIGHFEADNGVYPAQLTDLVRPQSNPPTTGIDNSGRSVAIPRGSYGGPYLSIRGGIDGTGIPMNPMVDQNAPLNAHWSYKNGVVRTTIEGTTLDGKPYSDL